MHSTLRKNFVAKRERGSPNVSPCCSGWKSGVNSNFLCNPLPLAMILETNCSCWGGRRNTHQNGHHSSRCLSIGFTCKLKVGCTESEEFNQTSNFLVRREARTCTSNWIQSSGWMLGEKAVAGKSTHESTLEANIQYECPSWLPGVYLERSTQALWRCSR